MNTQPKPQKELSESQINSAINIRKPMFLESARDLVKFLENQNDPLWWHNRPKFHYCVASFSSVKAKEWYEQHPEKRPQNEVVENQTQQVNQVPVQQTQQVTQVPPQVTAYGQNPAPQTVQPQQQEVPVQEQVQTSQAPQQQQPENSAGTEENSGSIKY